MKVEDIEKVLSVKAVRKQLGGDPDGSPMIDDYIEKMTPDQLIESWATDRIGEGGWGETIISKYNNLMQTEVKVKKMIEVMSQANCVSCPARSGCNITFKPCDPEPMKMCRARLLRWFYGERVD